MSGFKTDLISEATMQHQALEIMKLKEQLASSQAREQQLREALVWADNCPRDFVRVRPALALPQDDTALRQWGAKLLREMADNFADRTLFRNILRRKADEL